MIVEIFRFFFGIFIYWFVFFITTLVHETGHMVGYMLATRKMTERNDDWIIQTGVGKKILRIKRLQIHVVPAPGRFTTMSQTQSFAKGHQLIIYAGGPVFSLLTILAFCVLQVLVPKDATTNSEFYSSLIIAMRNLNIYMFLITMIPIRYPSYMGLGESAMSDGMRILQLFQKKGKRKEDNPL